MSIIRISRMGTTRIVIVTPKATSIIRTSRAQAVIKGRIALQDLAVMDDRDRDPVAVDRTETIAAVDVAVVRMAEADRIPEDGRDRAEASVTGDRDTVVLLHC